MWTGEGLNGESMGPQGLVAGHAYSILDCMSIGDKSQPDGRLKLIQLRNPWGEPRVLTSSPPPRRLSPPPHSSFLTTPYHLLLLPSGKYEWTGAWADGSKEWESGVGAKARRICQMKKGVKVRSYLAAFCCLEPSAPRLLCRVLLTALCVLPLPWAPGG